MFRYRLAYIYTGNMWRRHKKYSVYFICVILMYCLIVWLANHEVKKRKSSVYLHHVAVHFDLKGSPPKLSYLAEYLPILNMFGVNSIVMEYEDMFPYEGYLKNISSVNAYKKRELRRFLTRAKMLNIVVIPLIQTFGHMEFVLKLEQFARLRELEKFPSDICPSRSASKTLIRDMLKQVVELHGAIAPLQYIHIGCDEVMHINVCPRCLEKSLTDSEMFVEHVTEVTSIVKKITPLTKVLIWADMLHGTSIPEVYINNTNIEVVEWNYARNPNFSHIDFYSLHKHVKNIWIASAFKGADGRDATAPNIKNRFENHLSWMRFILDYKFGGENKVFHFNGIILTGWSRYSHAARQCELLPVAMPSLILNLLLIKTVQRGIDHGDLHNLNYCQFFHKYLSTEFREIFRSHDDNGEMCAFENTFLYREHSRLFDPTFFNDCFTQLHDRKLECQRLDANVDINMLDSSIRTCNVALHKLSAMKTSIEIFMVKYYELFVIESYVEEIVQVPAREIKINMDYLRICSENRFLRNKN